MNKILKRTHIKENIDLLKARDYYFDIAKKLNSIKTKMVLFPSFFLLIVYMLQIFNLEIISKDQSEIIVGILATIVAFVVYIFDIYIHKYTDISNNLRTIYDSKVLDVKLNKYIIDEKEMKKYLKAANKINYSPKYEVWYSEVFSENHFANVFCCQMDNLIYAKHAYKKAKDFYIKRMIIFSIFVIAAVIFSIITRQLFTTLLIIFSVLECYDVFVERITTYNEGLEVVLKFCDTAKEITPDQINETIVNEVQEVVNKNRSLHIFLPPKIRKQFLEDDNPFYKELDHFKQLFMGYDATIPEKTEDIEIMYEDGTNSIPLSEIQKRLKQMMEQVISIFDEEQIPYTLDGGTLIGAMRPNLKGFIPWDDDIDIAIPIDKIEKAKQVIKEKLNYVIQDYNNEKYYSPRLSIFKIREQNDNSMISEKDSLLYDQYENRGLFIDVYAYSPILKTKLIDKIFRKTIIHPLNYKLEKIENNYPRKGNYNKKYKKFLKLKNRYLKILSFYSKHANNEKYYAYFPGYIYDRKKSGPYHKANELFSDTPTYTMWENKNYKIPADYNAILSSYYGKNWIIPPFKTKNELIEQYKEKWYSKAPTKVTALKHISYIKYIKK